MKRSNFSYLSNRLRVLFLLLCIYILTLLLSISLLDGELRAGWTLLLSVPFILILYGSYRFIYRPYKETEKVLNLFLEGLVFQGVFDINHPFSKVMESVLKKFKDMIDTKDLADISKKQAEYLALQNQINPHFLYNTLEGIRSEALYADMDGIARMTEALATFFRYTISNMENFVTLEEELSNIENYYIIQQYRFGDRLNYNVEVDPEDEGKIMQYQLPKLILQPIIENAIHHGIEKKVGKGYIKIRVVTTPKRLLIRVSDDGLGISKEKLKELNDNLRVNALQTDHGYGDKKGGIAILNVNNRIKLLFGDDYGIHIYSRFQVGTDVDISLPLFHQEDGVSGQVGL